MEQQKAQNRVNIERLQSNIKKIQQHLQAQNRKDDMPQQHYNSPAYGVQPPAKQGDPERSMYCAAPVHFEEQYQGPRPQQQLQGTGPDEHPRDSGMNQQYEGCESSQQYRSQAPNTNYHDSGPDQQYQGPRPGSGFARPQMHDRLPGHFTDQNAGTSFQSGESGNPESEYQQSYYHEETEGNEAEWEEQHDEYQQAPAGRQQAMPPMPMQYPRQRMPNMMRPQVPGCRMLRPRVPSNSADMRFQGNMRPEARLRYPAGQRFVRPPPHKLLHRFGKQDQEGEEYQEEEDFETHEAGDGPGNVRPRMFFGRGGRGMRRPTQMHHPANRMPFRPRGPHFNPRLRNTRPEFNAECEEEYQEEEQEYDEPENYAPQEKFAKTQSRGPRPRFRPPMPHRFARPPRPRFPGGPAYPRFRHMAQPRPKHIQNYENVCVYDEGEGCDNEDDYLVEGCADNGEEHEGSAPMERSHDFRGGQSNHNVSDGGTYYEDRQAVFDKSHVGPEQAAARPSITPFPGGRDREPRRSLSKPDSDIGDAAAAPKLNLNEAARDIFANNPLFKGDNIKKLREHLQAIKKVEAGKSTYLSSVVLKNAVVDVSHCCVAVDN